MAESITYRIVEFNKTTGTFILSCSGLKPEGSYAIFENEFGATTGNRYNQIPRNRQAMLWLLGWDGCTIESVTLSLCSNISSGTAALEVDVDDEQIFGMKAASFDSEDWFGRWVNKDLHVYVDVEKEMAKAYPIPDEAEVCVKIKGGTQEGSVYVDAITIDYTPGTDVVTESPLPWIFEKIEAKGTLNDGDVVMMYRSGDAAGDIDGMETSHYLDAIGVSSTTKVDDPFISLFVAGKTDQGTWTLTNQYGDRLGATGAQSLAWNGGVDTWDITMGYDGATIANTNTKYGTMRYNAPSGSYPRFWNYTSKSLPLPYLYRRVAQQKPVISQSLQLSSSNREVTRGEQDTLVIQHKLLPVSTTDTRVVWQSSDEKVATVRNGIVEIGAVGETIITAASRDGGALSTCKVIVKEGAGETDALRRIEDDTPTSGYWDLNGRRHVHQPRRSLMIGKQKRLFVHE